MSSMENNKRKFSMEDFEKGLMLLGLITPSSQHEIHEKHRLEEYEKSLKKDKPNVYFKRAVLAAEIVTNLRQEPTFGRIKFQKIVYLCEHVANMNLSERYQKFAAGPFDAKFMHSIDKEFLKQKWFSTIVTNDGKYKKKQYIPMENCGGYRQYYDGYFGHENEHIQYILELFKTKTTDYTELSATVFACYLELVNKAVGFSWKELVDLFYNWSEKKKRFTPNEISQAFTWLQEHNLIPEVNFL